MNIKEKNAITNLIDQVKFWKKNNIKNTDDEILLNLIDKQQIELEKHKRLNNINEAIIEALKDKTAIQESIIRSFENGEMKIGVKYE